MKRLCATLLLVFAAACVNYKRPERIAPCNSSGNCTIEVRNTSPVPVELVSGNVSLATLAPHELRQFDPQTFRGLSGARMENGDSFVTRSCKSRWLNKTLLHFDCPGSSISN